jgi:hypothetical protein
MKLYRILLATALAATSSVASADVIFCHATNNNGVKIRYYTPFIDIGSDESAMSVVDDGFQAYLNANHPEGDRWDSSCDREERLAGSEGQLDWFKYNNKSEQWVVTDFTGGFPIATAASRETKTAGAHLTVKSTTPAAPAGPSAAELAADRHKAVEERNRAAQAKYEADLAAVEQAKRDIEARKTANRAAADKVLADHQREMEAHAQQVRMADAANLEYRKTLAKPAGVANAVYRGFSANDCAAARFSAVKGAGTDSGTQFKEVESEMISGGCIVRGWWWSTQVGGASRQ